MTEQGSFKNIINLVKNDRRYWIVVILLVALAIFGQKVPNGEDATNKCLAPAWNPTAESYSMSASQGVFTIKDFFNSKTGDYYRINFRAKATDLSSSTEISADGSIPKVNLEIWAKNNLGEEMLLGKQTIAKDGVFYQDEFVFQTNGDYQILEFRRTDKVLQDTVEIDKNIALSRLNITSVSEASQMLPTLGNKISLTLTPATDIANDKIVYNFSGGKSFGQTFQAETDVMSQVELKIHFLGSGGFGKYQLSLHEVNGGRVNQETLASLDFDESSADNNYLSNPALGLYRLPMVSRLEKGKIYYLGMDSSNVTTNFINHLQVYGSGVDQYTQGNAALLDGEELKNKTSDVYFKIVSPVSDKPDLTVGATVEDLGRGVGEFLYKSRGEAFDALAVFQKTGATKFDSDEKAILVEAKNDNNLIYKFNTIFPANKFHIKADAIGGEFVISILEYSLNETDWIKIDSSKDRNLPDTYEVSINANKSTNVYLRVSYSKDDELYKSRKYFGLKNLEVGASLDY